MQGEYGELILRYYGDSKREIINKYKQGVAWAKMNKQGKDEIRKKFLIALPDGSSNC